MNDYTERAQALSLLALALADDVNSYKAQMQQLGNPHLVAHYLVQMLCDSIPEAEHASHAAELAGYLKELAT